jgi:signal peptidase II
MDSTHTKHTNLRTKLFPLSLTALIIIADQITKAIIVNISPEQPRFITDVFNNGLLEIIHVRNKAIAFSLGNGLPDTVRPILFIALPLAVLAGVAWYYFKSSEFSRLQRWAIAGIIGGGLGNIIDRIFRPDGVVDFISVKFFGIFGLDRWPTFNLADAAVVVSCIILFLSILFERRAYE